MNYKQAYNAYDAALPDELRQEIFHGGRQNYHRAMRRTMRKNLEQRCHDLLRSLCVWRRAAQYPLAIQIKMLTLLSSGLLAARHVALLGHGGDGAAE